MDDADGFTKVTGEEGTYEFTLKNGKDKTISIPEGYTYEVTELTKDGWNLVKVNDTETSNATVSGTVNNNVDVTYTNEFIAYDLTISKTVSGNMGSKSQYFQFTINVEVPDVPDKMEIKVNLDNADRAISATAYDSAAHSNPTKITLAVASPDADTGRGKGRATATVWLSHGQSVSLTLPKGATYTVSEPDLTDYTESYRLNSGAKTLGNSASGTLTANTTVAFDNARDMDVPTGIYDSITPALVLLSLIGALGCVRFLLRRRKPNE